MHISEGILSAGVLAAGWAGTCAFTAIGLKKTEFIYEESTLDRKKFLQWKKLWGER